MTEPGPTPDDGKTPAQRLPDADPNTVASFLCGLLRLLNTQLHAASRAAAALQGAQAFKANYKLVRTLVWLIVFVVIALVLVVVVPVMAFVVAQRFGAPAFIGEAVGGTAVTAGSIAYGRKSSRISAGEKSQRPPGDGE